MPAVLVVATATAALSAGCDYKSATSAADGDRCHPSYVGECVPVDAYDVDCAGGSGDGPAYVGSVEVVGYDEYDLDRDGDGWACE